MPYRDDFERDYVKAMKWAPFVAPQYRVFTRDENGYFNPAVEAAYRWYVVGRQAAERGLHANNNS